MLKSWRDFGACSNPILVERINQIVKRCEGPKVLEVGCNYGFVAKAVQECRGFEVLAVDCDTEMASNAARTFGIKTEVADANDLPYLAEAFDTVIGAEMLEHLDNPGQGLKELFRVAKKKVIITLPVGDYFIGEKTHKWVLNGCVINHDRADVYRKIKDIFVIEFEKRTFAEKRIAK